MPNGRDDRSIHVWDMEHLTLLHKSQFEHFYFVGDYIAIASRTSKTIEAAVQSLRVSLLRTAKFAFFGSEDRPKKSDQVTLEDQTSFPGCKIVAQPCSEELYALMYESLGGGSSHRPWSITLQGFEYENPDAATRTLEAVSNSLFFQIDLANDTPLGLRRVRRKGLPYDFSDFDRKREAPTFPRTEYDSVPITLYWYASSASEMPLLQFLAYYQCIEFYFPTYSMSEARRRISQILKDPTFRVDRDSDLGKITDVLRSGPRRLDGEITMLRDTVHECVSSVELRKYLEESPAKVKHFSSKSQGLTDKRLAIQNEGADLRDAVSDRIYDIRCKIVHAKSNYRDSPDALLLPHSDGEAMLGFDIQLLRFIAQRVLIAGSSKLQVHN